MHTYTPTNIIFDGPITNLLSILRISVEVLSRAHAKRAKSLNDFKFGLFSNDGAANTTVKRLSKKKKRRKKVTEMTKGRCLTVS